MAGTQEQAREFMDKLALARQEVAARRAAAQAEIEAILSGAQRQAASVVANARADADRHRQAKAV